MKDNKGVGLAAPQVGINAQFFVTENMVCCNPVITHIPFGKYYHPEEGCLSVPDKRVAVKRARSLILSYQDEQGVGRIKRFQGEEAHIVQHEVDHLNGILLGGKV